MLKTCLRRKSSTAASNPNRDNYLAVASLWLICIGVSAFLLLLYLRETLRIPLTGGLAVKDPPISRMALSLPLFGGIVTFADAANPTSSSEVSIYAAGDLVKDNPIETTLIFAGVVIFSAILEAGLSLSTRIKAKYFQVMFATVNQEVMIVGILVLALLFAENVYSWPSRWVLIFKWSMLCLFLMVICFILMILVILLRVGWADKAWSLFETEHMDSEGHSFSNREEKYKAAFFRFQGALKVYGYSATMGIRFSTYLSKLTRKNVVALTDLTWVSWVCLATVVVVNALRTEGFRRLSEYNDENLDDSNTLEQRLLLYLSYVVIIGYGLLTLFLVMHFMLSSRLTRFLSSDAGSLGGAGADGLQQRLLLNDTTAGGGVGSMNANTRANAVDNLEDSRAFLFRRSLEVTLEMLQILLLSLLWYFSTFVLSFSYQLGYHMPHYAAPIIVLAVIPIIVVVALLPWTLMIITILGSLGNNLEENTIQTQIRKAGVPIDELPEKMQAALRANAQRKLLKQIRKEGMQTRQAAVRANLGVLSGSPSGAGRRPPAMGVPQSLQHLQEEAIAPIGV